MPSFGHSDRIGVGRSQRERFAERTQPLAGGTRPRGGFPGTAACPARRRARPSAGPAQPSRGASAPKRKRNDKKRVTRGAEFPSGTGFSYGMRSRVVKRRPAAVWKSLQCPRYAQGEFGGSVYFPREDFPRIRKETTRLRWPIRWAQERACRTEPGSWNGSFRRSTASMAIQVAEGQKRVAALEAENRELRARLNRNSRNSSRPPSRDPPSVPPRPGRAPTGRRPGGPPGDPAHEPELLPKSGRSSRSRRNAGNAAADRCGERIRTPAGIR